MIQFLNPNRLHTIDIPEEIQNSPSVCIRYKFAEIELLEDNFTYRMKFTNLKNSKVVYRTFEFNPRKESQCNQIAIIFNTSAWNQPEYTYELFKRFLDSIVLIPKREENRHPRDGFKNWSCIELHKDGEVEAELY